MKTRLSARLVAVALFATLAACGPQKHENAAHENQSRENFAHRGGHGIRAACAADIQKFCAQADRPRRCLKENIDKLSDACKTAMAQHRGGRNRDNDSGNSNNNGNGNDNDDQK